MDASLERLAADAEALDREAAAADWLAGEAAVEDDTEKAERIGGEARVLRAYAELNRAVIAAQVPVEEAPTDDTVVEVEGVTSDAAVTGEDPAPA